MKLSSVTALPREDLLDFEEKLRKESSIEIKTEIQAKTDEALQKAEEVKSGNAETTLEMMDRHNEMVKKSQELYKAQAKQRAIERQNAQRREEHSALLAEMALRNAQRRDLLKGR
jgi:hypothetical protein